MLWKARQLVASGEAAADELAAKARPLVADMPPRSSGSHTLTVMFARDLVANMPARDQTAKHPTTRSDRNERD
jgi:hypothetical protein